MARISIDRLEYYSDQFNAIADEAENYFRTRAAEAFENVDISDLDYIDKKNLRNQIIDIARETESLFCDASSSMGSIFYEEVLEDDGIFSRAMLADRPNDQQIDNSVRYWAKHIFGNDPNPEKFIDGVSSFVHRTVGHAADLTIMQSAINDEKLGIRYARVPRGPSCGFCILLASRGFVYRDRDSAGGDSLHGTNLDRFHDHCDCRIVAGYDGLEVEGYDYKGMYDRYKQCQDTITHGDEVQGPIWKDWERLTDKEKARFKDRRGNPSYNSYLEHRIVEEMNTRDRQWLYDGTLPKPTFETEELKRDIIEHRKHELRTAAKLRKYGIRPDFVVDYIKVFNEEKGVYETKGLADWANGIEVKTLLGASSYNTINGHIKNTAKKANAARLYFDNCENDKMSDETLEKYILRSQSFMTGAIYILGHDKKLRRIR